MTMASRGYDRTSPESLLTYAEGLVGHSLREALDDLPPAIDFSSNKGGFGTVLERHYFGYEPNSRPEPDFAEAGVELKATPLKMSGSRMVSKERLVLGMIDYMAIVSEEWESSTFLKKNSLLLLVFYLHEQGKDPRDFVIKIVRLFEFPPEDLEIIRRDWRFIVDKIKAGKAHELSEGDTLYLAACTKSSNSTTRRRQPFGEAAKPRAFSLKQSYMNTVIRSSPALKAIATVEVVRGRSFEEVVADRFKPYIGKTAYDIADSVGLTAKRRAKNYYAVLTNRILGVAEKDKIAEFEKADIQVKTMRLTPSGRPKEDLPFRAFDYCDLVTQEWESSDLREMLGKRFFFVIYQLDRDDVPTLLGTRFWTMPVSDIEGPARRCFEETQSRIAEDKAEYLPKSTENLVCHVRTHGRNSRDVIPTPSGRLVCRKSFWLNGSYIKRRLDL
jgi:DNA mismatch repair protein MutH